MYKTNVESLLNVGSIIKLDAEVANVPTGEYVVHEMVVCIDTPVSENKKHITYFLEDLSNNHKDDAIDEPDLQSAIVAGVAEVLQDHVLLYKVKFHDNIEDRDYDSYVYVKEGTAVSNEYFDKRIERHYEIAHDDDTGRYTLTSHDITVIVAELV